MTGTVTLELTTWEEKKHSVRMRVKSASHDIRAQDVPDMYISRQILNELKFNVRDPHAVLTVEFTSK